MRDDKHPVDAAEHLTRTYELLIEAARRAQDRPAYVAWALARVQAREGLSDEELAGGWLYVDDRDGFKLVGASTVRTSYVEPEASVRSIGLADREDGTLCRVPAAILDDQRGGLVCLDQSRSRPRPWPHAWRAESPPRRGPASRDRCGVSVRPHPLWRGGGPMVVEGVTRPEAPQTPAEWREAVDAAHVLRLIASGRTSGLMTTTFETHITLARSWGVRKGGVGDHAGERS